ncbi:hypothetical protein N0V82_004532 [Gnomoniopsis sp. IMI 355080]|nr:hypothetical protein N0V82_004532 [Gnomoniopsis sp. IMI 355080]
MAEDFFSATISSPGQSADLVTSPDNSTDEPFPLAQGYPLQISGLLDAFAKSYYSAVMWDLNFDRSNAFANENATKYLTTMINTAVGNATIVPNPILGSSDLAGSPAQFEIQYICSVPRKKDMGSLIISVVVADIVLLSVFWNLLNWVTLRYLRRRDPTWNLCPGCLHRSGPRPMSRKTLELMEMDQDPLCQNVDLDQETLYANYSNQNAESSISNHQRKIEGSVSSKSSQRTLQTLGEGLNCPGHHSAKDYVSLA